MLISCPKIIITKKKSNVQTKILCLLLNLIIGQFTLKLKLVVSVDINLYCISADIEDIGIPVFFFPKPIYDKKKCL